jgi:hypothetical protein
VPACSSVMLDPLHPATAYAGFPGAPNGVAPPLALAGLYTTDSGASWHMVPVPKGSTYGDFGGFVAAGASVAALFANPHTDAQNITTPMPLRVEVTSNGGRTWSPSTLGCPRMGPCVIFGPYAWGNCAMNGSPQAILLGAPSSSAGTPVRWVDTTWATTVNSCWSQQLAAASAHDVFLLDPSSQYALLESKDSGETWIDVSLPPIRGQSVSALGPSSSDSVVLAPDGSLYAAAVNQSGTSQQLYRLMPKATAWCVVPKVFGSAKSAGWAGPLRVNSSSLLWSQIVNNGLSNSVSVRHTVALSSLKCS